MRMIPACLRALAAGAVVAWAASPCALRAAPAAPDKGDRPLAANDKLRADLDKTISIRIDKQPLNLAVKMLGDKTGINFVLDSLTIQQQLGFQPEAPPTPVDLDLKDVKVRTALRSVVSPYGLAYAVIGDTVVITTEDMAMARQMHQRVNVDFNKIEFAVALRQLGKETAVNLVLDGRHEKEGAAKVSLQLEDVPLETAVRLLAEMAGLKALRLNNTMFVTTKDIAAELRQDPDWNAQGQPVQPNPPPGGVLVPPAGIPAPPPTVISNPIATPAVPPAVGDPPPDKTGDPAKPADDKKSDPDKKDGDK